MIDPVQYFEKGTVYRIRNRKTQHNLCLCSKLELKTSPPEDSPDQLWILNEIKHDEYEIVHIKTGTVVTQHHSKRSIDQYSQHRIDTRIDKRKGTDNQLWSILFAEKAQQINYFWITPTEHETMTFCGSSLNDHAKLSTIDHTLNICLWEFIPCPTSSKLLAGLSVFRSATSNLVIEVPDYASHENANVVQYLQTGGGNQRWVIELYEQKQGLLKQYSIKNYSSGLHLTAVFTKWSFRLTQALFNCSPDQRWVLVPVNQSLLPDKDSKDSLHLIQSVSNPEIYLGINSDRGGSPIQLLQDKGKCHWFIEGHVPID